MVEFTKGQIVDINKENINLLLLLMIVFSSLGVWYLFLKKIDAGITYGLVFLFSAVYLVLIHFWLKDDNRLKPITNYIRIPFATKLTLAVPFYLVGFLIPIVIKLALNFAGSGFTITSFSVPLFSTSLENTFQSFAAAEISSSMSWNLFITMYTAGTLETFAYNFVLPMVFVLLGWVILKLMNDGKDLPLMSAKAFVLTFALGMATVTFVLSHIFNGSYDLSNFIIAGLFITLSNISIYLLGIFATFWVGYHQSNNLIFLIEKYGLGAVLEGFFAGWFGFLFITLNVLLIFFLIRKRDEVWKDLKSHFRVYWNAI